MEIDHENNMLLSKIMGIMKRKNKSVHQARHVVRQANYGTKLNPSLFMRSTSRIGGSKIEDVSMSQNLPEQVPIYSDAQKQIRVADYLNKSMENTQIPSNHFSNE